MKFRYQKKVQHKARVSDKDRRGSSKPAGDLRDDRNEPYRRSDGYWYTWVNDGRGGYDQILSRDEQDRLDRYGPSSGWDDRR